ncbi:MFS transporter [Streptomyces violaceusniger]|uniref:MFS transporter n=1 Tax=Streptomyces violaceusniger TaxID=68280 RepID=UPI003420CC69
MRPAAAAPSRCAPADRVGRKPVLIGGVAVAVVGSVPAYVLAGHGSLLSTLGAEVLLVVPAALVGMPATIVAVELVLPRIRATSTALACNVAYAVFGGTAPLLGALLTERFGRPAPGAYITAVAAIALVVVIVALPETRGRAWSSPCRPNAMVSPQAFGLHEEASRSDGHH